MTTFIGKAIRAAQAIPSPAASTDAECRIIGRLVSERRDASAKAVLSELMLSDIDHAATIIFAAMAETKGKGQLWRLIDALNNMEASQ